MTAPAFALLAQFQQQAPPPNAGGAFGALGGLACCGAFLFGFMGIIFVCFWKVFEKAGRPGWEAIVPGYNGYVLTVEIAKLEPLWFFLQFVPFVGVVASFKVCLALAEKFRKSDGFGVGLALLPFVFFPMLAFGDATYRGKKKKKPPRRDYDDEEDDDYDDRRARDDDYDDEDAGRPRGRRRRDDD